MGFCRVCVLALAAMFCTPAAARAGTCLVLPFENRTRNATLEWIGESFVEALSDALAGPAVRVVTREERAAAFDNLGIPAASILTRATIIKLAETMDADCVITGDYSQPASESLEVSAQVLDLGESRLSPRIVESGPLPDLLDIQDRLGLALARVLAARASEGLPAPFAAPPRPVVPLNAWENYIRGLTAATRPQQTKFLREAARLDPGLTRAAFHLGRLYMQARDYQTAAPWLAKVRSEEGNYLEAVFLLGIAHFFLEDYARAENEFKLVAERVPLSEVYNNLGAAQSRRNRAAALDSFRKAAQGDPSDADYHFNVGFWHWKNGQHAAAVRRLRQALDNRAGDGEARALLVKALEGAGNTAEAAREREAAARSPVAARLLAADDKALESLERIKRNYDELSFRQLQLTLRALTEESLLRQPAATHAEAHLERGRELFREMEDTPALNELQEAARLDPTRAEIHLLMARLHERGGRADAAVREAGVALGLQKSVEAHLLLAKIYLEQSKLVEARQQAQQALELEPGNVAARSVLKTIEMRTP